MGASGTGQSQYANPCNTGLNQPQPLGPNPSPFNVAPQPVAPYQSPGDVGPIHHPAIPDLSKATIQPQPNPLTPNQYRSIYDAARPQPQPQPNPVTPFYGSMVGPTPPTQPTFDAGPIQTQPLMPNTPIARGINITQPMMPISGSPAAPVYRSSSGKGGSR
jgi:hypothetical protein